MKGLQISDFSVRYGARDILTGLTAGPLPRRQITALLGPNGSGKSTLLRALAGLTKHHAGGMTLDDEPVRVSMSSARSHSIVYLPQALPAGVRLQVLESVLVASRAHQRHVEAYGASGNTGKMSTAQALLAASAVLKALDISHLAGRTLDQLSGGQRQLVGLAQALVRQPQVLLLDEPLSALDLNHQFQVMQVLQEMTRARNMVTVVVLHDIQAALQRCDQAMLLHEGRIVEFGKPTDVITPAHLAKVFGVAARIERCTRGIPQVLIDGLVTQ